MRNGQKNEYKVPAVVVSLDSNGLAISRSLARRGVPVFSLWSDRRQPGLRSRYGKKLLVKDVTSPVLVQELLRVRELFDTNPALFLTNDNMVKNIGKNFESLETCYRIDWPSPELVLRLLDKKNLASMVAESGLLYPRSYHFSNANQLKAILCEVPQFPMILKPAVPPTPFKAFKVHDAEELWQCYTRAKGVIKDFILQEWVPGNERHLYLAYYYFDRSGHSLCKFVGRKIRSSPAVIGMASSVEPVERDDLWEKGLIFFKRLHMKGPAAVEFKVSDSGDAFFIEPTVGRYEYCHDVVTVNGIDIPFMSYCHLTEKTVARERVIQSSRGKVWVDFGRDFQLFVESIKTFDDLLEAVRFIRLPKGYALWAWDDPLPSLFAWPKGSRTHLHNALRKIRRKFVGKE